MTVKEILQQANTAGGKAVIIKEDEGRRLINRAVARLINRYDNACLRDTFDADAYEDYYELPEDCRGVLAVWTRQNHDPVDGAYWDADGGRLTIDLPGKFTVEYLKEPAPVSGPEDQPDIRGAFQPFLYLFVLGTALNDQALLEDFWNEAGQCSNREGRMKRRGNRVRRRW